MALHYQIFMILCKMVIWYSFSTGKGEGGGGDDSSLCRKDGLASHLQNTVEEILKFL